MALTSTPQRHKTIRIFCIAQLCIAFTVLLWHLSQPFVGDLFRAKAQLLVIEEVMGIPPYNVSEGKKVHFERNSVRFDTLARKERMFIEKGHSIAQKQLSLPFLSKLKGSFQELTRNVSGFEIFWIVLSIIVPILILKQVEGANLAIWLIPLVTVFYIYDNQVRGIVPAMTEHELLFPSEEELISRYIPEGLKGNISKEREDLKKAWNIYLVEEWAKEEPSKEGHIFDEQVEIGAYEFNVARAKAIIHSKMHPRNIFYKDSKIFYWSIFIWNFLFALICLKINKKRVNTTLTQT